MNSTTQRIVFTTEVRGIVRRTPKEEAAQREIMAVALAQPHRRGSDDPRMATPLGRFVEKTWSHKESLYFSGYRAGGDYARDVHAALVARGFKVDGFEPEKLGLVGLPDDPTPAQIAAQQAQIAQLDRAVARANETLVEVHARLPRAMERLCCTLIDPSPYDEDMLRAGLWRLAGHYGLLDRGINSLKAY
ncbi:MAG: hypothetical protein P4L76_17875 [Beijerinckiaceae bacterium]|nr:hypothetical protein [Beijerinckiaceae bacterium]